MSKAKQLTHLKYLFAAATALISILGCEVTDISSITGIIDRKSKEPLAFGRFRSEQLDDESIKKVLIMPFKFTGPEKSASNVTRTFTVEMNKLGMFQVVTPSVKPKELKKAETTLWDMGAIDIDILLAARKKYGVEGFIFGKITEYKPYVPLALGIDVIMVSALTGDTIWSVSGVFDSDQKDVVGKAKEYYKKHFRKDQSLYGWELILISMERYTRFIADTMVSSLIGVDKEK